MHDAFLLFAVLAITLILFIVNYWRYDVVAFLALTSLVILGIVPYNNAFSGFSNAAVITVACVMIMTDAVTQSGIVDNVVGKLAPVTGNTTVHIFVLMLITAVLSAFMNNIGALALMMPIAIQTAKSTARSPSLILMPISFASVLGGLTTAIGTPPNLLISAYRQQVTGHPFTMFAFTPVGVVVATAGLIFIALIGWRLLPVWRKPDKKLEDAFQIKDYITEVSIPEGSPIVGKYRYEVESMTEGDLVILGLIRNKHKRLAIPADELIQVGDILIIEATHDDLDRLVADAKLELAGGDIVSADTLRGDKIGLIEAVISPGSRLEGRSWQFMRIRQRYQINMLALAREGKPTKQRLSNMNLRAGDVLLLQGEHEQLHDMLPSLGLLPLAERGIKLGMKRQAIYPVGIFIIAVILATLQILPVQIAFAAAVLALAIFNIMPVRKIYNSIDWSVIILLAAMIPIGNALQTTGATEMIANFVVSLAGQYPPMILIGILLLITMTLSDIMNNAATAVVMAPIAVSIANTMKVSVDPFLMTVAVGASCSFLTPISHQNNTLVMGPGGYKFQDYPRLGLPIELIVLLVGIPMILWIWPIG